MLKNSSVAGSSLNSSFFDPEVVRYVEESNPNSLDVTSTNVNYRQLIINLEKCINRNQECRMKYAKYPEKFYESEKELDDAIQQLVIYSGTMDYFQTLIDLEALPSILGLLDHENIDICHSVINLLIEWLREDVQGEYPVAIASFRNILDKLFELQLNNVLVNLLEKFNDESKEEEKQIILSILSFFDNLFEICGQDAINNKGFTSLDRLYSWLLNKILKEKSTKEENKPEVEIAIYASEILSIILSCSGIEAISMFTSEKVNGVELLLQILQDKSTLYRSESSELIENAYDSLCAVLLLSADTEMKSTVANTISTMLALVRSNKRYQWRSLKALNYTLTSFPAFGCTYFVSKAGGLRQLFPMLMNMEIPKKLVVKDEHEHLFSLIAALLTNLFDNTELYLRILSKFAENNFEKTRKLLAFRSYYKLCSDNFLAMSHNSSDISNDLVERNLEEYQNRLDNGLFTLQLIDRIICFICNDALPEILQAVELLLQREYNISLQIDIKNSLLEYLEHYGEDGDQNSAKYISRIESILQKW